MPARTFLYGFLGFIAVAGAVTMFSDPLDPDVGNGSINPADWSENKLKTYLQDVWDCPLKGHPKTDSWQNDVPFAGEDNRRILIKLVRQHQKIRERAAQATSDSAPPPSEREPLLNAQKKPSAIAAAEANERLEHASNLK
ncbi:protein of unknown function [Taphrina deformans PYCC 5710]|uniref:Uncharacterized protein n=1 Tax=Taphrina deformans (strain PYCC 5710 / ATCC 11124 / CBS 356.35 / IMI 108563 / JCM 9778 / NBRC 8474) TaxID=1097556 RepID=R4XNS9_TAPDE|nr:protein of unknown function [Taphrina deformans PYCC 5710]|eukprot:CCG84919.1 protein of unknown function [Taphrina deformans PYCC 5710]